MTVSGYIVDIPGKQVVKGSLTVTDGKISQIIATPNGPDQYILPGFIDAHVHIESSMLVPSAFARMAVVHGTVATVSDPHEIANVMGMAGVDYMIRNGSQVPFKFYFGAPSCVPATSFETAGALVDVAGVDTLLCRDEIRYLAEMMNWPGVLAGDREVFAKIASAKKYGKVVDGHAPGLTGERATRYIAAGISTDHECVTEAEALHKLKAGMKVIIREGSAARNFDALIDLLNDFEDRIMFCSDDKHPDSLEVGHINELVRRAVARGVDVFKVLKAACINPVMHYGLEVGQLRVGDPADFIVVDNLMNFEVRQTVIGGVIVAAGGKSKIAHVHASPINNFHISVKSSENFQVKAKKGLVRVIEALDGQLVTRELLMTPRIVKGLVEADVERDILKVAVVNRYSDAKPTVALIKNFGLQQGAIASSVAHDSHNIIAVGVDDLSISRAVNRIMEAQGGISAVYDAGEMLLPLPVAGIMSPEDGYDVAQKYKAIDLQAKSMGSKLGAPFMTLSFMALLVIPSLKVSDRGLFNGDTFRFVELFSDPDAADE
ncbi:MAG: adenine deaminase [Cytophagales bacterium]|nr:adenine deaminase [Cytophagales bacterium]